MNKRREFVAVFTETQYREKRQFMEMLTKLRAAEELHGLGWGVVDQFVEWREQPQFLVDDEKQWACCVTNLVIDGLDLVYG